MEETPKDNIYLSDMEKVSANYAPLSPLSFLRRSADVHPDRTALIHGEQRCTWAEVYARCRCLASALSQRGLGHGDTVAVLAPNVPAIFEAHFAVPMIGAVLNTINTRLDADTIAYILQHGEAKVLITDREFSPTMAKALGKLGRDILVIDIDDPLAEAGECVGEIDYESFLASGDPTFQWSLPEDEWQALSLSYTSGTTGNPKGVVYSHRGAYLNALGNILAWEMAGPAVYLWTLPMFHCNGWVFPYTITALAGCHVCLRRVEPAAIFREIVDQGVTHFCGAPIVLNMLINAKKEDRLPLDRRVKVMTAAAPPPASVIERMEKMGFDVTHVYGLTEVYGPAVVCAWHREWDRLAADAQAQLKARQGVRYEVQEDLAVVDPKTLAPVPADGQSIGEIFMRGNIVMRGYLKNPSATEEAFRGGWFHTGDLAVRHPDGYVEIKDRAKDIIISGGENISTVEVESALYRHPEVMEAAVVARPDEKWGETPCAFVTLKPEAETSQQELIAFCRENLAHFKCPKTIVFGDLPKTSTGKVQKFVLRERARALSEVD